MTVAVLLLGVPMAIFGAVLVRESVTSDLRLRTESLARAVETRLTFDLDIDADYLDRWVDESPDMPMRITVLTPDGGVVAAGDEIEGNTYRFRQNTPSGGLVVVEVPSETLFWRGAQVVILVVVACLVAFAVGALVAGRQARRLAAPLIYLAASAEQLGAGKTKLTVLPSGVEEIDLVANELVRSGERMAARMASEREFAANASHQLRTPLTALSMRLEEIEMTAEDPHIAEEARAGSTSTTGWSTTCWRRPAAPTAAPPSRWSSPRSSSSSSASGVRRSGARADRWSSVTPRASRCSRPRARSPRRCRPCWRTR